MSEHHKEHSDYAALGIFAGYGDFEDQLDAVREQMVEQDIIAAMAVRDLMSATQSLSELASSKSNAWRVCVEANDIELAYTRLGRMLSHIRERSNAA